MATRNETSVPSVGNSDTPRTLDFLGVGLQSTQENNLIWKEQCTDELPSVDNSHLGNDLNGDITKIKVEIMESEKVSGSKLDRVFASTEKRKRKTRNEISKKKRVLKNEKVDENDMSTEKMQPGPSDYDLSGAEIKEEAVKGVGERDEKGTGLGEGDEEGTGIGEGDEEGTGIGEGDEEGTGIGEGDEEGTGIVIKSCDERRDEVGQMDGLMSVECTRMEDLPGSYRKEGWSKVTNSYFYKHILANRDSVFNFCFDSGLLPSKRSCKKCHRTMSLTKRKKIGDGHIWRCQKKGHCCDLSIRHGTWFQGSNLHLWEILELTYLWVSGLDQISIRKHVDLAEHTVVDWAHFCREVCLEFTLNSGDKLIGGEGVAVEIDESKFAKKKNNGGQESKEVWVFGGREKEDGSKCFMVEVPDRSAETLIPIIQEYIAPGSIIYSDSCKAYEKLPEYGYQHYTVNHSREFVNAETGCHTNGIVGEWQKVKQGKYIPKFGCKRSHLQSYISVHLWHKKYEYCDKFLKFIECVVSVFDGNCGDSDCGFCKWGK